MEFSKGDYTALVIPEIGANLGAAVPHGAGRRRFCARLRPTRSRPSGAVRRFSECRCSSRPTVSPTDVTSSTGRTYRFPITIEKEHNYHHGILKSQPFAVSKAWETDEETLVECRYYSNAGNDAVFRDFPHEFKCKLIYRLTPRGMEVEAMFANRSRLPMPVGAGFHTPSGSPSPEARRRIT